MCDYEFSNGPTSKIETFIIEILVSIILSTCISKDAESTKNAKTELKQRLEVMHHNRYCKIRQIIRADITSKSADYR